MTLLLHDSWEFGFCPYEQVRDPASADRLPFFSARVPGCTIDDLQRNGLIDDPFLDAGFRSAYWTEQQDFWYRCTFVFESAPPPGGAHLELDGLDTYAVVWLNGERIGESANMFRRRRFSVDGPLRPGVNTLHIRLLSPVCHARALARMWSIDLASLSAAFRTNERLTARKMQMSYGWDNHPRLVGFGVYRPVRLVYGADSLRLVEVRFSTVHLADDRASAVLRLDAEIAGGRADGLSVAVTGVCGDSRFSHAAPVVPDAAGSAAVEFEIHDPRLWWPNGSGPQSLYAAVVRLIDAGRVVDERSVTFGVRTVHVRTGPPSRRMISYRAGSPTRDVPALDGGDEGPWSRIPLREEREEDVYPFVFSVNGTALPIVGANWQPCDAVYSRATPERVRALLRDARDMGLNMIRVWGGGYVEVPEFYEACTELGLLVWQDFPFASAIYPQAEEFLAEVEEEAKDIVRRLRAYTCLAAWCGDNESDMSNYDRGNDPSANAVNHRVLPLVVAKLDPGRYYHPSSPFGVQYPRSPWSGDNRNWGPWNATSNYLHIRREESRFISEGGAYALPSLEAIERGVSPAHRWPLDGWVWNLHGGSTDTYFRDFPAKSIALWECFAALENLEQAVEVSQFAQAWGAMALVLHCRRRWPETGGVLWWKLDDCWPCMDGGLVDWAGERRIAYYAVRYAARPRILCFFQPPGESVVELHLINHTGEPFEAEVTFSRRDLDALGGPRTFRLSVRAQEYATAFVHAESIADASGDSTVFSAECEGAAGGVWTLSPAGAWRCYRETDLIHTLWLRPSANTGRTAVEMARCDA